MGIHFPSSFHDFFEQLATPIQHWFAETARAANEQHMMMWDCYASGQMSDADLEGEIARDPAFASFVAAHGVTRH